VERGLWRGHLRRECLAESVCREGICRESVCGESVYSLWRRGCLVSCEFVLARVFVGWVGDGWVDDVVSAVVHTLRECSTGRQWFHASECCVNECVRK